MIAKFLLALALGCCAVPAAALLIRTDRDDAEYLELASRYTASVALDAPDGEGVLVAPRWVLTAAHRARALQGKQPLPPLRFAGRDYEIEALHLHPGWKPGGANDIALIQLKADVRDVAATPIHRVSDEAGKTVVIVGHGATGRIGEALPPGGKGDGKKRAAINAVDAVTATTLVLKIRPDDDASDLQGASTPGDSGGPAFIQVEGDLFVAGIASALEDTNRDGRSGNVGDREIYTRVSAFAGWIDAVMLEVAAREVARLLGGGN